MLCARGWEVSDRHRTGRNYSEIQLQTEKFCSQQVFLKYSLPKLEKILIYCGKVFWWSRVQISVWRPTSFQYFNVSPFTTVFFHTLSGSLFTNLPFIKQCIIRATERIISAALYRQRHQIETVVTLLLVIYVRLLVYSIYLIDKPNSDPLYCNCIIYNDIQLPIKIEELK